MVGEYCGTERSGAVQRVDHRWSVFMGVPAAGAQGYECFAGAAPGAAGGVGGDDSFPGAAACGELAIHGGVVFDARVVGEQLLLRNSKQKAFVAAAVDDAGVGECAWRISSGLCPSRNLLDQRGMAVVESGFYAD